MMSEAVAIALITNGCVVLCHIFSRWLSHLEHKGTERKVDEIHEMVNGKG